MAEQLGSNQGGQKLLAGKGAPRRPAPRSRNPAEEVIVVNASEKRYLWTARAFAVIVAISS